MRKQPLFHHDGARTARTPRSNPVSTAALRLSSQTHEHQYPKNSCSTLQKSYTFCNLPHGINFTVKSCKSQRFFIQIRTSKNRNFPQFAQNGRSQADCRPLFFMRRPAYGNQPLRACAAVPRYSLILYALSHTCPLYTGRWKAASYTAAPPRLLSVYLLSTACKLFQNRWAAA